MVAGMKFLSKKGFNPSNMQNQKRVWEARQSKKQEEQKIKEREEQLKRERDEEELAIARGEQVPLKFMYAPPPGMETAATTKDKPAGEGALKSVKTEPVESSSSSNNNTNGTGELDITKVQPGDDPAAAAFRRMLAAATAGNNTEDGDDEHESQKQQSSSDGKDAYGIVLQGTSVEKDSKGKEGLSALEKAVGRRDGNQSLTLEEQVARFPQLKNAPMAKGMSGTDIGVSFKPLGAQLRNVRCLACGIWGHSRGERECPKSGWNPFALNQPARSAAKTAEETTLKNNGNDDEKSVGSSSSSNSSNDSSEDSYRERKRRKKSKRRHRKKESKRSRKRSRSESPDRKRHRRSRSDSPDDRERSRKKSKRSRRKESSKEGY